MADLGAPSQSKVESWSALILPLALIVFSVMILEFYVEAVCAAKMEAPRCARYSTAALFLSALLLAHFWTHPFTDQLLSVRTPLHGGGGTEHVLSGGVVVSAVIFVLGQYSGGAAASSFLLLFLLLLLLLFNDLY